MRFSMEGAPQIERPIQVGDVFRAKGPRPTRFWLVLALGSGSSLHLAGLDEGGRIVSTASYGDHAMERRERVGRCHEMADWCAPIVWEPGA